MSQHQRSATLALDPLTTHSRIFDQARGITPNCRAVMQWIAENGRWLRRSSHGWHGVNSGGPTETKEALKDDVVAELDCIGVLQLFDGRGRRLPDHPDSIRIARHARLAQLA